MYRDIVPRFDFTHQGQLVSASQNLNAQRLLDLGQIAVEFPAKVDQKAIIRKFQKGFLKVFRQVGRGQCSNGQSGLRQIRVRL